MGKLPSWTLWAAVAAAVLLSPCLSLLLVFFAVELLCDLVSTAGFSGLFALGFAGAAGVVLLRRLRPPSLSET